MNSIIGNSIKAIIFGHLINALQSLNPVRMNGVAKKHTPATLRELRLHFMAWQTTFPACECATMKIGGQSGLLDSRITKLRNLREARILARSEFRPDHRNGRTLRRFVEANNMDFEKADPRLLQPMFLLSSMSNAENLVPCIRITTASGVTSVKACEVGVPGDSFEVEHT
jgi:hypothetical protein